MNEESIKQDGEISLIDLFAILWRWKWMIIGLTFTGAVISVFISIISLKLSPEKSFLPNRYTPQTFLLIDDKSLSGGGFSPSGDIANMGGLAAIAGVGLAGRATYAQLAIFLVMSNSMLDSIVDEFDLIKKYKIENSPKALSRKMLKGKLKVKVDEKTSGVVTISFTDKDPVFARDVVNFCAIHLEQLFGNLGFDKSEIERENLEFGIASAYNDIQDLEEENRKLEQSVASIPPSGRVPAITTEMNRISLELSTKRQIYSQLKVRLEMLKVSMASEKKVLQILEMAEIPDMKSGPSRAKFCMSVTIVSFFLTVFLAFLFHSVSSVKNNPRAMAKLRGEI